jgi:hypothetical protein
MVEVVTGFEFVVVRGVENAIGGVEDPDGEGHGSGCGGGKANVAGAGDEPGPERGNGGGVERQQVP